jgi:two-component system, OmpR family, response regulator MprA
MSPDSPKKVLVVDDEKDLRDAMTTALSYQGYAVTSAVDGIEAMDEAKRTLPDLILLDIMMPRQDGITTLKAIKKEAWGKNIPVIIMTVLDDMAKVAEAIEAGASEYLVKTDIPLGTIVQKVKDRLG